jgi:hypothetical protein
VLIGQPLVWKLFNDDVKPAGCIIATPVESFYKEQSSCKVLEEIAAVTKSYGSIVRAWMVKSILNGQRQPNVDGKSILIIPYARSMRKVYHVQVHFRL